MRATAIRGHRCKRPGEQFAEWRGRRDFAGLPGSRNCFTSRKATLPAASAGRRFPRICGGCSVRSGGEETIVAAVAAGIAHYDDAQKSRPGAGIPQRVDGLVQQTLTLATIDVRTRMVLIPRTRPGSCAICSGLGKRRPFLRLRPRPAAGAGGVSNKAAFMVMRLIRFGIGRQKTANGYQPAYSLSPRLRAVSGGRASGRQTI